MDNPQDLCFGSRWLPAVCVIAAIGSALTTMPAIADRSGDHLAAGIADRAISGPARTSTGPSGCATRGPLFAGECVDQNARTLTIAENDRGIVVKPIPTPPPPPAPPIKQTFTVSTPIRIALARGERELLSGLESDVCLLKLLIRRKSLIWPGIPRHTSSLPTAT